MEVVGTGYEFGHNDDYQRTAQHYVKDGTLIYDDVTGYEFEKFVEKIQPDLVGSGIKEKYVFQKMGVPFRQMHSWDYSGPYHGYDGFAIFARDMDMAINSPIWKKAKAPWKAAAEADPDGRGVISYTRPLRTRASRRRRIDDTKFGKGLHHDTECRPRARSLRAVPRPGIPADAGEQEEDVRESARSGRSRAGPRMGEDARISREEFRARGADGQSGQGLPAARRGVRRGRASRAPFPSCTARKAASPITAAIFSRHFKEPSSCVSSSMTEDAAVFGGLNNMIDGLANTYSHVQAEDDRGLDHLHGGSDRRRPQRLHQDRKGEGLRAGRIRRAVRPYARLRRQPCHRIRQCAEGHHRAFLGRQGRHGAEAGAPAEREDQLHRRLRRLHRRQHPRDQAHLRADGHRVYHPRRQQRRVRHADRRRVPHV